MGKSTVRKLWLFLTLLAIFSSMTNCYCGGKCCQGENHNCVSSGPTFLDFKATTCFCDESCITRGDCCLDYISCNFHVDCIVDRNWSEWGSCNWDSGRGVQSRIKRIIRHPSGNGKLCTDTVQRRNCSGSCLKKYRSISQIIPIGFSKWNSDNYFCHENKSQFLSSKKCFSKPLIYCTYFEVTRSKKACKLPLVNGYNRNAKFLTKGSRVCIECRASEGQKCHNFGHHREIQWRMLTVNGCRGRWKPVSLQESCSCNAVSKHSFLVV